MNALLPSVSSMLQADAMDLPSLLALRQNLERFRLLVENSQDLVAEVTREGEILYVSPNVRALLGYPPGELLGTRVFEHIHPEDLPAVQEQFALPEGSATCRFWHKDGSWRWLETSGRDFFSTEGELHGVLIARDVTARKETEDALKEAQRARTVLEEQLRQAQKLESLGTLAGGIAHDFNNILGAIMAYADLARMDTRHLPHVDGYLGHVLGACDRAKELVRQILTFSRQQVPERKPIKLPPVIAEGIRWLRSTLPASIEIVADVRADTGVVLADATHIHQVLINLCTNAAHAMQAQPGRLEVRLEAFAVDEALARIQPELRAGPYVRLSVSDTGHGMDSETQKRIFEPFFTTKAPGDGTGLGLAVVHGIVKNHDGAIQVNSHPGEGTTIHAFFPVQGGESVAAEAIAGLLPQGGGERVLVVDDEPALCHVVERLLRRLNYSVTTRCHPHEALQTFRAQPDAFDLVLTDLNMPGMTGLDLARELLKLRPGLPVLLATGFSGTLTPDNTRPLGICDLVPKPMNTRLLAEVVRGALREKPRRVTAESAATPFPKLPLLSVL